MPTELPPPPDWSLIADVARTLLLLGIPALLKFTSDIRRDQREHSERLAGVEIWMEEHEKRDNERFDDLKGNQGRWRRSDPR